MLVPFISTLFKSVNPTQVGAGGILIVDRRIRTEKLSVHNGVCIEDIPGIALQGHPFSARHRKRMTSNHQSDLFA